VASGIAPPLRASQSTWDADHGYDPNLIDVVPAFGARCLCKSSSYTRATTIRHLPNLSPQICGIAAVIASALPSILDLTLQHHDPRP
jgi:hypothetical protein